MLTLIDLCRAAKEERHLTNKDIADGSGVPLGTVNNLFRSSTHSPPRWRPSAPAAPF